MSSIGYILGLCLPNAHRYIIIIIIMPKARGKVQKVKGSVRFVQSFLEILSVLALGGYLTNVTLFLINHNIPNPLSPTRLHTSAHSPLTPSPLCPHIFFCPWQCFLTPPTLLARSHTLLEVTYIHRACSTPSKSPMIV